jgi:caffeoyl-CoA O-methyltransferase
MAGLEERIVLHEGNALELIPAMNGTFDLVFIDADKEQYVDYYKASMEKLCDGGLIIADNVLWGGKVLEKKEHAERETRGILDFNKFVMEDERVEKILIPMRDGLFLIRKKEAVKD